MRNRVLTYFFITIVLCGCERPHHQYQGYVEGEDIYLATPASGKVVKMCVERGQRVKKGQLLFQLDRNPQVMLIKEARALLSQAKRVLLDIKKPRRPAEINAIKAQIAQADVQLRLAAIRVKRNQILYEKHVLDKDSLDASVERQNELAQLKVQFESNLTLALEGARSEQIAAQQAQVQALSMKLKQARWDLEQKAMYAPDNGKIFDVYFRLGEFVSPQRPVMALLTPNNTRIEFFVPLEDLPDMHVGKPIQFRFETCNKQNDAVISYVSPEAEYTPPLIYSRENSHKLVFRIKARVKDAENVMPGQPVIVFVPGHDHDS